MLQGAYPSGYFLSTVRHGLPVRIVNLSGRLLLTRQLFSNNCRLGVDSASQVIGYDVWRGALLLRAWWYGLVNKN